MTNYIGQLFLFSSGIHSEEKLFSLVLSIVPDPFSLSPILAIERSEKALIFRSFMVYIAILETVTTFMLLNVLMLHLIA